MSAETKIASRYAKAFFELVLETKQEKKLEKEVLEFLTIFESSEDLSNVFKSTSVPANIQNEIILEIAKKAKMSDALTNLLRLLCENRRLDVTAHVLKAILKKFSDSRGEVEAQVMSATKLTAAQEKEIVKTLSEKTGLNVKASVTVDTNLIGGIVVKVGSYMIDDSLKTKLEKAKRQLKGAA